MSGCCPLKLLGLFLGFLMVHLLRVSECPNFILFIRQLSQLKHNQSTMYPHFYPYYGPTITEIALSRENALLNTEVNLLQSQNRRLKTQIISRKYSRVSNPTASIGSHKYSASYLNRQYGTPQRSHNRETTHLHRYNSQNKYRSTSNEQERASRSINIETKNRQGQRERTPNQKQSKFHYDVGERKVEENRINATETIIERLQSEDFRINPERASYNQTHIKQVIHEDPQEQSSIREYQPLEANKKTNLIYMMKSMNNSRQSPGARLSRISKKTQQMQQSGEKHSKKKYLEITSEAVKMTGGTKPKKT